MIEKNLASSTKLSGLSTADLAGSRPERARDDLARTEEETGARAIPIVTPPPVSKEASLAMGEPRPTLKPSEDERGPLFSTDEANRLRSRWDDIQTGFVDAPRQAVESADELVATAMKRLAEMFAKERQTMEKQWESGDNVSTEDLRIALQRYRSFFGRLLSV